METKVNYTVVGIFVLLLSGVLIAGILWLSTGSKYRKSYDTYLAFMHESVSGLNINAPVKYRGVEVGRVRDISLDADRPEQVRLVLDIERGTPVRENTIAILKVQGLTGIAYVELDGGTRDSPLLKAKPHQRYPVIQTGPSLLARLDTSLTDLLASLKRTSDNINDMLDPDNRRSIKQMISDLAAVSHELAGRRAVIARGIDSGAKTLENTAEASARLSNLLERLQRSADAFDKMTVEAAGASASARNTLDGMGKDVHRFTNESLPEFERTMVEIRALASSIRQLSDELERNPAVLLHGKQSAAPGPGE
jgi:phospholipid/cholesterol/gamma-HCH transport system substrate-binding protein